MIYILVLLLTLLVIYYFFGITRRNALDVYYSLAKNNEDTSTQESQEEKTKIVLTLQHKIIFVFAAIIITFVINLFIPLNGLASIIIILFALSLSFIFVRILATLDSKKIYKIYDFYLPIVMERLVMAVQGGNDVYAAISIIIELSKKNGTLDPVTKLLDTVIKKNKSGIGFEEALSLAASSVNLTSIRHAFLHLGIAQKEGGEIIGPMEELSDSTQEYYQQIVEKEIAVLPVKATMPLLLAFCGLLIFFIAVPISQLMAPDGILLK